MYKIILKYKPKQAGYIHTDVYTYFDIESCRAQIKVLKYRYISMDVKILELKMYKVEQIPDPEQI